MNAIIGFSTLLSDPSITDEERQEFIRIIKERGAVDSDPLFPCDATVEEQAFGFKAVAMPRPMGRYFGQSTHLRVLAFHLGGDLYAVKMTDPVGQPAGYSVFDGEGRPQRENYYTLDALPRAGHSK